MKKKIVQRLLWKGEAVTVCNVSFIDEQGRQFPGLPDQQECRSDHHWLYPSEAEISFSPALHCTLACLCFLPHL